jgi:hypothetical protein
MRDRLTQESLKALMRELARSARPGRDYRVWLVGGGTAVLEGWRESSIDADLVGSPDDIFRDVQALKERLRLNIEFARPEDFVPPLKGSESRHLFIETIGRVSFYHYDPYAQVLSKIVRGFARDIDDAKSFISSGMVEPAALKKLVRAVPASAYSKYPRLSAQAVAAAVDEFLAGLGF